MLEYKTSVHHIHSPFPYENEQMKKYKPSFDGWFTIDELRKMNAAIANKNDDWTPNVHSDRPESIDLYHPHRNYYILIHDARNRSV
jgi:hypothetical protein